MPIERGRGSRRSSSPEPQADQEYFVALVACGFRADDANLVEDGAKRIARLFELGALKDLCDERTSGQKHGFGQLEGAHDQLVASILVRVSLAARLRCHVADHQVERPAQRGWVDLERVERADLGLRRERDIRALEIDPEDASRLPHTLSSIERPRAWARSEVEHSLALLEQTEPAVDFLQLVDGAGRIALAPCATTVVVLLSPGGQLALLCRFRSGLGSFLGRRLR